MGIIVSNGVFLTASSSTTVHALRQSVMYSSAKECSVMYIPYKVTVSTPGSYLNMEKIYTKVKCVPAALK